MDEPIRIMAEQTVNGSKSNFLCVGKKGYKQFYCYKQISPFYSIELEKSVNQVCVRDLRLNSGTGNHSRHREPTDKL